jgi:outer membrane protein assembly factor BamB
MQSRWPTMAATTDDARTTRNSTGRCAIGSSDSGGGSQDTHGLVCYDLDGNHSERLGPQGYYYSSPVAADHRIYIASVEGVVVVLEAGEKLNILATNKLDGRVLATPALVDGNIYVRTESHLYAFGN